MTGSVMLRRVWSRRICRLRHHHAVMTGHVSHHLVRLSGVDFGAQITWLRHSLEPESKRGDEPEHRSECAEHAGDIGESGRFRNQPKVGPDLFRPRRFLIQPGNPLPFAQSRSNLIQAHAL